MKPASFSMSVFVSKVGVRFQFVGQPQKRFSIGPSVQPVMVGALAFYYGRSCHTVTDLTGNETTSM